MLLIVTKTGKELIFENKFMIMVDILREEDRRRDSFLSQSELEVNLIIVT